jgi:hypothetical protein
MGKLFDDICRTLATPMPRLRALKLIIAGVAAAILAPLNYVFGQRNSCSPGAIPCTGVPNNCCPPVTICCTTAEHPHCCPSGATCCGNACCPGGQQCIDNDHCQGPPSGTRP